MPDDVHDQRTVVLAATGMERLGLGRPCRTVEPASATGAGSLR